MYRRHHDSVLRKRPETQRRNRERIAWAFLRRIYRSERTTDRSGHRRAGEHADAVRSDSETRRPAGLPTQYAVLFNGAVHAIADAKPVTDAATQSESIAHRHRGVSVPVSKWNRADELPVAYAIEHILANAFTQTDDCNDLQPGRPGLVSLGACRACACRHGSDRYEWQPSTGSPVRGRIDDASLFQWISLELSPRDAGFPVHGRHQSCDWQHQCVCKRQHL